MEDLEKDTIELDKKIDLYYKMKKTKKEDSLLGDEEMLGNDEDYELIRKVDEEIEK